MVTFTPLTMYKTTMYKTPMTIRYYCLVALVPFLCLATGCGLPDDLPPLAPFQITVTKDGVPAEAIIVTVHSDDMPVHYNCFAVTSASGTVTMVTHASITNRRFPGAPVGPTKIGLRRVPGFGLECPEAITRGMTMDEIRAFSAERARLIDEAAAFVPRSLNDPMISPIEFNVEANTRNELTIELNDPQWDVPIDPARLRSLRGP